MSQIFKYLVHWKNVCILIFLLFWSIKSHKNEDFLLLILKLIKETFSAYFIFYFGDIIDFLTPLLSKLEECKI